MTKVSIYYSPKFEDLILVSSGQNGIVMEDSLDLYKVDKSDVKVIVGLNYDLIGFYEEELDNK